MNTAVLMMPFPPSTNTLFVNNPKGGRWRSRRYTRWAAEASFQLEQQGPLPNFTDPVMLVLSLGKPDKRKRDVSNTIKAVEDLLVTVGVLKDDELVHDVRARWDDAVQGCVVEIRTIPPLVLST